jgi:hypothetical protein
MSFISFLRSNPASTAEIVQLHRQILHRDVCLGDELEQSIIRETCDFPFDVSSDR